jgi:signal transduction histidine kinase
MADDSVTKVIRLLQNDSLSMDIRRVILSNYFSQICQDDVTIKLLISKLEPVLRVDLIEHYQSPLYISDSSLNEKIVPVLESIVASPLKHAPEVARAAITALSFYGNTYIIDHIGDYVKIVHSDRKTFYGPVTEYLMDIISFDPSKLDLILEKLFSIAANSEELSITSAKLMLDIVYKHCELFSERGDRRFYNIIDQLRQYSSPDIDDLVNLLNELAAFINCDGIILFDVNKTLKSYRFSAGVNDDYIFKADSMKLYDDDPLSQVVFETAPLFINNKDFFLQFGGKFGHAVALPCSYKGDVALVLMILNETHLSLVQVVYGIIFAQELAHATSKLKNVFDLNHLYDKLAQDYSFFARGLKHEIKTPLGTIKNSLFAMKNDSAIKEKDSERIASCVDACEIIKDSLEDFNSVTDPSEKDKPITEVLETLLRVLECYIVENGIVVIKNFDYTCPKIKSSTGLRRVAINIIMNSIHAFAGSSVDQKERRIEIETLYEPSKGRIVVKISDNGPGIPEIIKDKIFEPSVSTTGGGMGLYLADSAIKNMHGTIEYESSSAGTRFTILLPAHS